MDGDDRAEVVVVGAGPVGLALGLDLARRGVDVLVLEKNPSTAETSRAPGIWSPTQAYLAELGQIDRFLGEGMALRRMEMVDAVDGRVLLRLPIEELAGETDYPQLLILPQSQTERLLCEALQAQDTGRVRFGCEVTDVSQTEQGAQARWRAKEGDGLVRCRFVAGCDGAHSRVREAIGGRLEGKTYPMQVTLADFEVEQGGDLPPTRLTTDPMMAVAIRMDARLWRLILPFTGEADPEAFERRLAATLTVFFGARRATEVWRSDFRLHNRLSTRWRDGRIVLAGDAAHLNSPVGGEGMNAGLLDAQALAEALAAALKSDATEPLAAYAERRRAVVGGRVNPFTDRLTGVVLGGRGRLIRPALGLARAALKIGPLRRRALRRLAMLQTA